MMIYKNLGLVEQHVQMGAFWYQMWGSSRAAFEHELN